MWKQNFWEPFLLKNLSWGAKISPDHWDSLNDLRRGGNEWSLCSTPWLLVATHAKLSWMWSATGSNKCGIISQPWWLKNHSTSVVSLMHWMEARMMEYRKRKVMIPLRTWTMQSANRWWTVLRWYIWEGASRTWSNNLGNVVWKQWWWGGCLWLLIASYL